MYLSAGRRFWQHINLQGEYDFSEENLKNPIEFQLPELLDLQVF